MSDKPRWCESNTCIEHFSRYEFYDLMKGVQSVHVYIHVKNNLIDSSQKPKVEILTIRLAPVNTACMSGKNIMMG